MGDYSLRSLWLRLSAPDLYHRPVPELLRLCASSDQKAFCALYDRFKKSIFRYAYFLCENEKRAQQLTQNAFLRSYKQCSAILSEGVDFGAWLYREVNRDFLSSYRNDKHELLSDPRTSLIDWQQLQKISREHLLIALEEIAPHQRAAVLIWLFSKLREEEQAWVFDMRSQQWSAHFRQSLHELSFWMRELEQEKSNG